MVLFTSKYCLKFLLLSRHNKFLTYFGIKELPPTLHFKPFHTDQACSQITFKDKAELKKTKNKKNTKGEQSVSASLPAAAASTTSVVTAGLYVNAFFKSCVINKTLKEGKKENEALIQQILFLSGGALRVSSRRVLRVNESAAVKISFCRCWRRGIEEATKKGR